MNDDIEKSTRSSPTCQTHQASNAKEPLIPTENPPRPWHTIATDMFETDNSDCLLVSDYYSKFPFVGKIPTDQSSSRTVTNMMKQIVSEQGIPTILCPDNGPHYNPKEFEIFANEYNFKHSTSSPHNPRSNGFIASQVKYIKTAPIKSNEAHTDPNIALLYLRSTQIDHKLSSPAELLLGRKLQENLPRSVPQSNDGDDVRDRLYEKQALQKAYHERTARSL